MRGVGRVLPYGISLSTWAVAAGVAVLCVALALSIAGMIPAPKPGARPLPRTAHLPLQPNESPNRAKKAAREAGKQARLVPDIAADPSRQGDGSGAGDALPQTGRASWYDLNSKTASGETMDGDKLTAAHNTLPLGTRVRVANLDNGRAVVVRINDRGPFAKDRIIDLSKAAAERFGMIADGVANVRVTPVEGAVAITSRAGSLTR